MEKEMNKEEEKIENIEEPDKLVEKIQSETTGQEVNKSEKTIADATNQENSKPMTNRPQNFEKIPERAESEKIDTFGQKPGFGQRINKDKFGNPRHSEKTGPVTTRTESIAKIPEMKDVE